MSDDRGLMNATSEIYKLLISIQGKEATFQVLRDKKEVKIKVKVPVMELQLKEGGVFV